MILDFPTFYRNYGLRRAAQLTAPRFRLAADFQLPRAAILHVGHLDPLKYGPTEDDIAFRGFATKVKPDGTTVSMPLARQVWLEHQLQMSQPVKGMVVKSSANAAVLMRQFHNTYKRFRRVTQPKTALMDQAALYAVNYGMLPHLVRYQRSPYNNYFDWMNVETTMWDKIAEMTQVTDRPQFIIRHMPQVLPARSALQQYAAMDQSRPNRRLLNTFHSAEHLFLAEVWKWFGKDRNSSLLSKVPKDKLRNINIIFIEAGHWLVLNLGLLNSWRKAPKEEMLEDDAAKPVQENLIAPDNYQNLILRMFMAITHLRTDVDPELTEGSDQVIEGEDVADVIKELSNNQNIEDRVIESVKRVVAKKTAGPVPELTEQSNEPEDTPMSVKVDDAELEKIEADLQAMERIKTSTIVDVREDDEEDEIVEADPHPFAPPELKRPEMHEAVMNVVNKLAEVGQISAAQYRNFESVSSAYKTIIAPDGKSTMEEFIQIPPDALKIAASSQMVDIPTVADKSMLKASLGDFDERYITEIFQRDVASMVMGVQYAGVAVADYRSEHVSNIMGDFVMYSARLIPAEGSGTTVHWKLPYVNPDGEYMANGTKYKLRKQRVDLPIRKTAPDTVALTSYYGKSFVRRSEKKTHNYGTWICNQIMSKMLTDQDTIITNGHPGNLSDNLFVGPRLYTILASSFNGFVFQPANMPAEHAGVTFQMNFDHTKREELFGAEAMAQYEKNGAIIAGKSTDGSKYFLIGKSGMLGIGTNGSISVIPRIEALLDIPRAKAPVDIAVIKIAGGSIPLGVMLAYEIGLDALIRLLGAKVRKVPVGTRVMPVENEETIVFQDMTLVIDRNDVRSCLFLAGFNEYHAQIRQYSYHLFNRSDVYLNLLEDVGLTVRHMREMDLFYQMFIDPITRDILVEMGEPTDMRLLLVRAGELLVNDDHPDEFDAQYLRARGYERMAGAVYTEMVKMIRNHNGRSGKGRQQLNMDPYAIFTAIQTDPSKAQVLEINPIQQLKEQEAVTYNGTGGRNSRTMTKSTRAYHENDKGTISGDTVDSGDVGINIYTSADPQFTSLRGMSKRYEKSMGAAPLLSTSALISVGSDHDDQKRVGFIGIQHTHAVSSVGNHQMFVRTGYEAAIAQRTSDLYAAAAKEDGTVLSITEGTGIVVQYASGKKQGIELGTRYGNAAGLTIPHDIIANMKPGQTFKRGEIIAYNSNFFEKDLLDPKNVVWKQGVLAKVVLMETTETLEDSSAISEKLAGKLNTHVTKVIPIVVPFEQSVSKLVKAGDRVSPEDILCIIEDAVTARAGLFTEESLDTLRILSNQSPQAKVKGVVERVEVFYHGEVEDMSESLAKITEESDKALAKRLKSINKPVMTGAVDDAFRVDGESLPYGYLAIRVYITSLVEMGEGDKGVFANQMKSVFGKKMVNEVLTEDGEVIDAIFGNKSIEDRIVLSPYLIGTTNVLLDLVAQAAVAAYRS